MSKFLKLCVRLLFLPLVLFVLPFFLVSDWITSSGTFKKKVIHATKFIKDYVKGA